MNTNVVKAAGMGILAAMMIGGAILAGTPRTPAAEACVLRAQESGCCVIRGSGERDENTSSGPAGHLPLEGKAWTEEYRVSERLAVGILPSVCSVKAYTEEELELLACAIYCEAGGDACTDETRRMVGEVILNRAADPRFPDTILEVLTQKNQYGHFHWTGVVWPSRAAHEPEAVERAYRCAEAVLTEPRLLPEDVVFQAEFTQGEIVASAPGFYFCR